MLFRTRCGHAERGFEGRAACRLLGRWVLLRMAGTPASCAAFGKTCSREDVRAACCLCFRYEDLGMVSYRQNANEDYGNCFEQLAELDPEEWVAPGVPQR